MFPQSSIIEPQWKNYRHDRSGVGECSPIIDFEMHKAFYAGIILALKASQEQPQLLPQMIMEAQCFGVLMNIPADKDRAN